MRNEIEQLLNPIMDEQEEGNLSSFTLELKLIEAVNNYVKPFITSLSEANKLTTHHIAESIKKDIEISELKMEIEKLKTK